MVTLNHALVIAFKDIRRCWVIIIASLLASVFHAASLHLLTPLQQSLQSDVPLSLTNIAHLLIWAVCLFGLIPIVIKEDSPASYDAMTHTRPISKLSIALGKLFVITLFGAVIPSAAETFALWVDRFPFVSIESFGVKLLISKLVVLVPASIIASCFANISHYFILTALGYYAAPKISYLIYGDSIPIPDTTITLLSLSFVLFGGFLLYRRYLGLSSIDSIVIIFIVTPLFLLASGAISEKYRPKLMPDEYGVFNLNAEPSLPGFSLSSVDIERHKRFNWEGNEEISYRLTPSFTAPGHVVRVRFISELSEVGKVSSPIEIPYLTAGDGKSICLTFAEVEPLLDDSLKRADLDFNESPECSRIGALPINPDLAKRFTSSKTVNLSGKGLFDIYSVTNQFRYSDKLLPDASMSRIRFDYFNPFRFGYIHPQLIETSEFVSPEMIGREDNLSVFSILKSASGVVSIEPLDEKSVYYGRTALFPSPIHLKRFWVTAFKKPQLDFLNEGSIPDESSVIGIRARHIGAKMLSFSGKVPVNSTLDEQR